MIAHVGGVPIEEALLPLVTYVGAGLLFGRTWIASHVRRRRRTCDEGAERPPL